MGNSTPNANENATRLDAALQYALGDGWAVFPLHNPVFAPDGAVSCSCGDADCRNIGKHPRTAHGFKDATTDEEQIRSWWSQWPDANIGIATGERSGIDGLDIDPDKGGVESLAKLFPDDEPGTYTVRTGGGGGHYYFRHAPGVKNRTAVLPGIDVRGDGGYIVAPPSVHESGKPYVVVNDAELADWPEWLIAHIQVPEWKRAPLIGDTIPEGERDVTLTSLAGSMRHRGLGYAVIAVALHAANRELCDPPLSERQVDKIARSVSQYEPGVRRAGTRSFRRLRVAGGQP